MSSSMVFVVSAPSGVGKTTVINRVLEINSKLEKTISHTTRKKRPGEIDGHDYHFVDESKFKEMIDEGAFVEWAEVYENYYGTSYKSIENILSRSKDAVLIIEWQGAHYIQKRYKNSQFILMLPPNMEELKRRLENRKGGDNDNIQKRLASARDEVEKMNWYDHIVVNDQLEEAVKEVNAILNRERKKKESDQRLLEKFLD